MPVQEYLEGIRPPHSQICDLTLGYLELMIFNKLVSVVLFNSLPCSRYRTVIQQLLANIKTLTMSQVTARLQLKAALMSSNKDRFKDVYAAKVFRNDKRHVGKSPKYHCHVHPNGKHLNEKCFQQNDWTAALASNRQLTNDEVVRQYQALFSSQENNESWAE